MAYKLFLDDIRSVDMIYKNDPDCNFIVVRTYADCIDCIKTKGLPSFMSFDNDLGVDDNGELLPTGYDVAKWLVYKSGLDLKNMKYRVHSSNPVAKRQIESLLGNYINFLKR